MHDWLRPGKTTRNMTLLSGGLTLLLGLTLALGEARAQVPAAAVNPPDMGRSPGVPPPGATMPGSVPGPGRLTP